MTWAVAEINPSLPLVFPARVVHDGQMMTITEALAALPEEPNEIAALFGTLGIKGRAADACRCPIHQYLALKVGEDAIDTVGINSAWGNPTVLKEGYPYNTEYPLPWAAQVFISHFDQGRYPALEIVPGERAGVPA